MWYQYYPFLCTAYAGNNVGGCMGERIVSTLLYMILWTFSRLDLVLHMCTSGMLQVLPLYGWCTSGLTSVSSEMTWVSVSGGCIFVRSGVIVIFAFLFTLWHDAGYGGTVVAGCCVLSFWCDGSGVCSALGSCSVGGEGSCGMDMLKMAASCFSSAIFFSKLRDGAGWGWVL